MYDPVTLDQLRAFLAVVEEGSFSAAARRLKRVQSAVSTSMANLEAHLGVPVWDRSTRVARLTPQGQALLGAARRVLSEVDALRRLTAGMGTGLEPSVSLCLDALYPLDALLDLCAAFSKEFPSVDLRIDTQVLSAVSDRVLAGSATLGVAVPVGIAPGLERHALAPIRMVAVASPRHPLARLPAPIPTSAFADAIQIVLSERTLEGVEDQGVLSPRTWRVGDLHTKHAMLRASLGWGNLPEHVAREDLRSGRLVAIRPAASPPEALPLYLYAVYRTDAVFGPAHRWLLERLGRLCERDVAAAPGRAKARGTRKVRRPGNRAR